MRHLDPHQSKKSVRPVTPQAKFWRNLCKRRAKSTANIWRKNVADFRPSISRQNGRKKFHEKSSTFSTVHRIEFFHCCNFGKWGPQKSVFVSFCLLPIAASKVDTSNCRCFEMARKATLTAQPELQVSSDGSLFSTSDKGASWKRGFRKVHFL